jgi:hypothetical protein
MRRFSLFFVALFLLSGAFAVPSVLAQDRVAVGAFVDYFNLSQTHTNFVGVGGRVGVGLGHHLMLEGQMSFDFNQAFTEDLTNGTGLPSVQRSGLSLLHGEFGPKVAFGHGNLHPFLTVKGGFMNTRFDSSPATIGTFASDVSNLRSKDVMGVLYPGGGVEGRIGPIGIRLDIGDEIYFNDGTHHNLSVGLGPYIRF